MSAIKNVSVNKVFDFIKRFFANNWLIILIILILYPTIAPFIISWINKFKQANKDIEKQNNWNSKQDKDYVMKLMNSITTNKQVQMDTIVIVKNLHYDKADRDITFGFDLGQLFNPNSWWCSSKEQTAVVNACKRMSNNVKLVQRIYNECLTNERVLSNDLRSRLSQSNLKQISKFL